MTTNYSPNFLTLTVQPLRTEGKVLLPIGAPFEILSDYLHITRAVREESRERGWSVHKRSEQLVRCVVGETSPSAVVKSGGGLLLAVYVGGVD